MSPRQAQPSPHESVQPPTQAQPSPHHEGVSPKVSPKQGPPLRPPRNSRKTPNPHKREDFRFGAQRAAEQR